MERSDRLMSLSPLIVGRSVGPSQTGLGLAETGLFGGCSTIFGAGLCHWFHHKQNYGRYKQGKFSGRAAFQAFELKILSAFWLTSRLLHWFCLQFFNFHRMQLLLGSSPFSQRFWANILSYAVLLLTHIVPIWLCHKQKLILSALRLVRVLWWSTVLFNRLFITQKPQSSLR